MNERRELAAQAESTQQLAVEHASSLAERLPEELVNAIWWMCVHAARRVAFEETLPGEKPRKLAAEAQKSKLPFQKHQAIVAEHVPAALATSLAEIGAHAARYAARSHLGMSAPLERAAFERAAAEVERLQGSLPRLWRGAPIPTGPNLEGGVFPQTHTRFPFPRLLALALALSLVLALTLSLT